MWIRTYSKTFKGLKKIDIWHLWTDINHWPEWHDDLESCTMEGPFKLGAFFILKPKGIRAVKIVLTEIQEGKSFTDCTTFLGAKMYNTHALEETSQGLKLIHTLVVTGPLTWRWVKLVGQHVADSVPQETEALVKQARSLHG